MSKLEVAYTHHEALREVDRLRAQNAMLLEALIEVTPRCHSAHLVSAASICPVCIKYGRAQRAIAAAKGE